MTHCFISHNSTARLLPLAHFNPTLQELSLSAHPVLGYVGPLASSRLGAVKVLPDVPLNQPTLEYLSEASLLWLNPHPPLKVFSSLYPGMRSEFQIRIRVSVWISCIRYLLKHISPSVFNLSCFAGSPKRRFILCSPSPLL